MIHHDSAADATRKAMEVSGCCRNSLVDLPLVTGERCRLVRIGLLVFGYVLIDPNHQEPLAALAVSDGAFLRERIDFVASWDSGSGSAKGTSALSPSSS